MSIRALALIRALSIKIKYSNVPVDDVLVVENIRVRQTCLLRVIYVNSKQDLKLTQLEVPTKPPLTVSDAPIHILSTPAW